MSEQAGNRSTRIVGRAFVLIGAVVPLLFALVWVWQEGGPATLSLDLLHERLKAAVMLALVLFGAWRLERLGHHWMADD